MPIPKVIFQPDSAVHLKQGFDRMADLLAITLGPSQGRIVNQSQTKDRPELLDDAMAFALGAPFSSESEVERHVYA